MLLLLVDSILGQACAKYSCPPSWAVIGAVSSTVPRFWSQCYGSLWLNSQVQPRGEDLCLRVISLQTPQRQMRLGRRNIEMRDWNTGLELQCCGCLEEPSNWLLCLNPSQASAWLSESRKTCLEGRGCCLFISLLPHTSKGLWESTDPLGREEYWCFMLPTTVREWKPGHAAVGEEKSLL